jgi:hypothetical protein
MPASRSGISARRHGMAGIIIVKIYLMAISCRFVLDVFRSMNPKNVYVIFVINGLLFNSHSVLNRHVR